MQRLATGLGIAAALLLIGNLYFLRQNARLEAQVEILGRDVVRLEQEVASAAAGQRVAGGARPARVKAAPTRRPARRLDRPGGPAVQRGAGGDPDRFQAVRENVRERTLDRMLGIIGMTGDQRGWSEEMIVETQAIIEDAFVATGEVGERARAGEITAEEAMQDAEVIREQRELDLLDVLGEEESAALRSGMRGSARQGGRGQGGPE